MERMYYRRGWFAMGMAAICAGVLLVLMLAMPRFVVNGPVLGLIILLVASAAYGIFCLHRADQIRHDPLAAPIVLRPSR